MSSSKNHTRGIKITYAILSFLGSLSSIFYLLSITLFIFIGMNQYIWILIFLLLLIVQITVMVVSRKRFINDSHQVGSVLLLLGSVTLGLPFMLFSGCIALRY